MVGQHEPIFADGERSVAGFHQSFGESQQRVGDNQELMGERERRMGQVEARFGEVRLYHWSGRAKGEGGATSRVERETGRCWAKRLAAFERGRIAMVFDRENRAFSKENF